MLKIITGNGNALITDFRLDALRIPNAGSIRDEFVAWTGWSAKTTKPKYKVVFKYPKNVISNDNSLNDILSILSVLAVLAVLAILLAGLQYFLRDVESIQTTLSQELYNLSFSILFMFL